MWIARNTTKGAADGYDRLQPDPEAWLSASMGRACLRPLARLPQGKQGAAASAKKGKKAGLAAAVAAAAEEEPGGG